MKAKNKNYPPSSNRWVKTRHYKRHVEVAYSVSKNHYSEIMVGRKIVGEVQNGVFVKLVKGSKHFLRVPPAIAFNTDNLDKAAVYGAVLVKVIDIETGNVYQAPISIINEKGFLLNRGYGQQIALPMKFWNIENNPICKKIARKEVGYASK